MILSADLHLRKTPPRARTDDYWATQERKIRFILEQAQASPPLLVAGDFFHQPRPGPFLEKWVIDLLNEYGVKPVVVPGQHDLPGHSLDQIGDSGLGVLAAAGVIELLNNQQFSTLHNNIYIQGCSYGENPIQTLPSSEKRFVRILLWHHMVINSEPLWPGQVADKALGLLKKYPQFDLITTGDNHQTFAVASPDGRWLVNAGSMMRMTAAQVDHRPCVFRWEGGRPEQVFLPIEPDVLDLSGLEEAKARDSRTSAFVERLERQWEIGLDFNKNVEQIMQETDASPEVRDMVRRCLK